MSTGQTTGRPPLPADDRGAPGSDDRTIVIRDRRKPNQYTTDNIIAREWLPILRVGDAFFFYSVYLSMANRETESSWGSLRTQAEYLQCGVDLIVRGNRLLEICELLYIESGDHRSTNEYYILEPPHLTAELHKRIVRRLDQVEEQETGKNWQAWAKQVRKALDRHRSLPSIWEARRARKGGRPVRTVRPAKGDRESQAGFSDPSVNDGKSDRDSHAGYMWPTTSAHVSHDQRACDSHAEQEKQRKETKQSDQELLVRTRCACLDVSPAIVEVLLGRYPLDEIQQQLDWLPLRDPRDPAAMLVSALQNDWDAPSTLDSRRAAEIWAQWLAQVKEEKADDDLACPESIVPDPSAAVAEEARWQLAEGGGDARTVWRAALDELQLQMTRSAFDTWLRGAEVLAVEGQTLVVGVRDSYAVEWLNARWIVPVERTLSGVAGYALSVRFEAR